MLIISDTGIFVWVATFSTQWRIGAVLKLWGLLNHEFYMQYSALVLLMLLKSWKRSLSASNSEPEIYENRISRNVVVGTFYVSFASNVEINPRKSLKTLDDFRNGMYMKYHITSKSVNLRKSVNHLHMNNVDCSFPLCLALDSLNLSVGKVLWRKSVKLGIFHTVYDILKTLTKEIPNFNLRNMFSSRFSSAEKNCHHRHATIFPSAGEVYT